MYKLFISIEIFLKSQNVRNVTYSFFCIEKRENFYLIHGGTPIIYLVTLIIKTEWD
jgi:hypothetical protein